MRALVAFSVIPFVWWGVSRLSIPTAWLRLRVVAFIAAALVAYVLIDSRLLLDQNKNGKLVDQPTFATYFLKLNVHAPAGLERTSDYRLEIYQVQLTPQAERQYVSVPASSAQFELERSIALSAGRYMLKIACDGCARLTHEFELHADEQREFTLALAQARSIKVVTSRDDELSPVAGATVFLSQPTREDAREKTLPFGRSTDRNGVASFNDTPSGPLLVEIYAPGYQPYRATTEGDLVVRLEPASTLEILVRDGGEVQADAEVVISGPSLWPPQSVKTRADGSVKVTGLAAGNYAIFARKGERISQLKENTRVDSNSGAQKLELELGPGTFVRVRVVSAEADKPLAQAKVSVGGAGLGQFLLYDRTGVDGRARLGPLLSSSGIVQARAAGYVAASAPFPRPAGNDDSENETPPSDEIELKLVRAGSIVGRVVDERGMPVSGVSVEAVGTGLDNIPYSVTWNSAKVSDAHFDWAEEWGHDSSRVLIPAGELGVMLGPVPPIPLGNVMTSSGQSLTTDERGYFEIEGVPPGEGIVLCRHPDYLDGKSAAISLAPGAEARTEIVLRGGQPLMGRLVDHRGFPVAGAGITATARGFERRIYTASDGNFELGAAPRSVSLRVNSAENPLLVLLVREVSEAERDQKVLIELAPPRADLLLSVSDGQKPIGLAQVTLTSLDPNVPHRQTRFTLDDGEVRFEAVAGLMVRIVVEAYGFVSTSLDKKLSESERVVLKPSLRAQGKVTGVRGRHPASGAELVFKSGTLTKHAIADELGEYQFIGLPPGRGILSGSHSDYGRASKSVVIAPGVGDRPFELPMLELAPTVILSGTVEDETGRRIAGAAVSSERIPAFLSQHALRSALSVSDENGQFSVQIEASPELYLYGAKPAQGYGYSDAIQIGDQEKIDDVIVIIDHPDKTTSYEQGTVLISLEERDRTFLIYAVALGSQAEQAGLRAGDQLMSIDGRLPSSLDEARELLSGSQGGQLRLVVNRAGREIIALVGREAYVH